MILRALDLLGPMPGYGLARRIKQRITRDVFVPEDGILGGAGIFGAQGATEFTAKRVR